MRERDQARRHRVAACVAAGEITTGEDAFYAASILQHGDMPEDAWQAHVLALDAAGRGYAPARWLAAAAYDRWRMYQGHPQKYGTQYVADGRRQRLWDVDPATTDADRAQWDVPPLAEQVRKAEEATRVDPPGPLGEDAPWWLKDAVARWYPAFPNPERAWLPSVYANTNVRVGADRVLRTYRRDPRAARKEEALLRRPWTAFVVPAVLGSGDDFLVLEYVSHHALGDDAEVGACLGRAAAEIHRRRFPVHGFLDADLNVHAPFDDVIEVFTAHAREELARVSLPTASDLRSSVAACLLAHGEALRRAARTPVLLHGDFKVSNLHETADHRLLVLDWEFAYAGPALMDIGQLLRWRPSPACIDAFADHYRQSGGDLPEHWDWLAEIFDLINLVSLLNGAAADSRRAADVQQRIEETLSRHGGAA